MKILFVLSALIAVGWAVECPGNEVVRDHCNCDYELSFRYARYELVLKCYQLVHDEFEEVMESIRNISVHSLSIVKSHIQDLTPEQFEDTEIHQLVITSTIVETIQPGAFGAIKDLQELYLIRTGLKEIPDVSSASILNTLSIQQHGITTLKESDFTDLKNLNTLEIIDGDLNLIEEKTFAPLANLDTLILNHNYLSSLPDDLVLDDSKLTDLELNDNHLESVPESLAKAGSLQVLDLRDNLISNLTQSPFETLLKNGVEVHVEGNILRCDQSLCWYAELNEQSEDFLYLYGNCKYDEDGSAYTFGLEDLSPKSLDCPASSD